MATRCLQSFAIRLKYVREGDEEACEDEALKLMQADARYSVAFIKQWRY